MNNVPIKQVNTRNGVIEIVLYPLAVNAEVSDDEIHRILFHAMGESPNDMNVMSSIERIEIEGDEKIIFIRDSEEAEDIDSFYHDFDVYGPEQYYLDVNIHGEMTWHTATRFYPAPNKPKVSFRLVK